MSVYCTTTQVERYLEASHGLTLAGYILEGSGIVNDDLENRFWVPFPDVTDTPATPYKIQRAAYLKTALIAREALGTTNYLNEDGTTVNLEQRYQAAIDELLDPNRPTEGIARVLIAAEEITLGTDPLEDYQYKLDPGGLIAAGTIGGFEVIPESATIDVVTEGLDPVQYGTDYFVFYSPKDRGWLLQVLDTTNITDAATITYWISWYRHREAMGPVTRGGINLVPA